MLFRNSVSPHETARDLTPMISVELLCITTRPNNVTLLYIKYDNYSKYYLSPILKLFKVTNQQNSSAQILNGWHQTVYMTGTLCVCACVLICILQRRSQGNIVSA